MSRFNLQVICHTKNTERFQTEFKKIINRHQYHNDKILESNEKLTIIKMLQWATIDMHETNEKTEIPIKEIENIKKNQMEILELKITIFKIKI